METRGGKIFGSCFFAALAIISADAALNLNLIWQSAEAARWISGMVAFMLVVMTAFSILRPKTFWETGSNTAPGEGVHN